MFLVSHNINAQYFQHGGIFYNVTSNTPPRTVEVTYDTTNMTKYSGNITIPDSITVGVTYRVTKIGYHSFTGCDSLTSITIPPSIVTIGDSAGTYALSQVFSQCTNLCNVNYTGTLAQWCDIKFLSIYDNPVSLAKSLHINGTLVTNVNIPNSLTTILPYTFCNDTAITTVNIPSSVDTIGNSSFRGCKNLRTLNMANSIRHISKIAFAECSNLDTLVFPDSLRSIGYEAFMGCHKLLRIKHIILPPKLEIIEGQAFHFRATSSADTFALERIDIPRSVKKFGQNILPEGCPCGFSIYYDGTLEEWIGISHNYIHFPKYKLYINNRPLNTITIPSTIDTIKPYVFSDCIADSLIMGNNVKVIDSGAFFRSAIKYISFPDSLKRINYRAFSSAQSLSNLYIHSGTIGHEAFHYHSLANVIIGEGVDTIIEYAFQPSPSNLCHYYFKDSIPPLLRSSSNTVVYQLSYVFGGNLRNNAFFHFPCGYATNYLADWRPNSGLGSNSTNQLYMESPHNCHAFSSDNNRGNANITTWPDCNTRTCIAQAQPFMGYKFSHWSNGQTSNPLSVYVTQDTVLAAYFSPLTLTAYSEDTLKGTVNTIVYPDESTNFTALLQAVPKTGYHFTGWSNGETDSIFSLTLTQDTVLIAYFGSQNSIDEVIGDNISIKTNGHVILLDGINGERVVVSDVLGRVIYNCPVTGNTTVNTLSNGIFFIKIGGLPAKKIVITR